MWVWVCVCVCVCMCVCVRQAKAHRGRLQGIAGGDALGIVRPQGLCAAAGTGLRKAQGPKDLQIEQLSLHPQESKRARRTVGACRASLAVTRLG